MWIRQDISMPNSDSSYMSLYTDSWVPGTNSPTWGFTLTGSGRLALSTYRSGSWYGQYSTGSYSFGSTTWRQVAVTWSGTSVKYYIDGLIDSTINYGVPLTTTNTPLGQATIAKIQWWNNPFSGSIAGVRAYNSQISDAEIAALCQEMAPRFSGFSCR